MAIDTVLDAHRWAFLREPPRYVSTYNKFAPARKLAGDPADRQLRTAAEILRRLRCQRGVLLADDVGLGKTTVAAVVACTFAALGLRVRVLAPNATMADRWRQELGSHVKTVARFIPDRKIKVAARTDTRLHPGGVVVTTHRRGASGAKTLTLSCDLLIIDEAHRAKSEESNLAKALQKHHALIEKVLILTATPFSIRIADLCVLLKMVGGDAARAAVDKVGPMLDELWTGRFGDASFAKQAAETLKAAITALQPWVIRHSVAQLPTRESRFFGRVDNTWAPDVPHATDDQIELLLRTDRLLTLGKRDGSREQLRTNDPRFHVGWTHLREQADRIDLEKTSGEDRFIRVRHQDRINALLRNEERGDHPKVASVVKEIGSLTADGERVVVFCDHHATAGELALAAIRAHRQGRKRRPVPGPWAEAWRIVMESAFAKSEGARAYKAREGYIHWLSSEGIAAQVSAWLPEIPSSAKQLAKRLRVQVARRSGGIKIADAAEHLWIEISRSRSNLAIFGLFGDTGQYATRIHGSDLAAPGLIAVCKTPQGATENEKHLFFDKGPDLVLALFNSPFGPDILITTDRLSEGFDLHRFCRHLIHYELDPSPIRTVQRNGRLRRVECWAARIGQPLRIAYPAFAGTRDERLVEVMQRRLRQYDLLLGGVGLPEDLLAEVVEDAPQAQSDVLAFLTEQMRPLQNWLSVV